MGWLSWFMCVMGIIIESAAASHRPTIGLLVFDWVGGWMREGKPLPYDVDCIGFVVRYADN